MYFVFVIEQTKKIEFNQFIFIIFIDSKFYIKNEIFLLNLRNLI